MCEIACVMEAYRFHELTNEIVSQYGGMIALATIARELRLVSRQLKLKRENRAEVIENTTVDYFTHISTRFLGL